MAYCRFSDESDVYMYHHVDGYIVCCMCSLGIVVHIETRKDAHNHLMLHKERGDKVPKEALEKLQDEMLKIGDKVEVR